MPRAVVIGGGPAGSSAAFHLTRAGWCTTLIEARAFPRLKVCGEFISPAATTILEDIIPPADLRAAGARRVSEFVLEVDDRSVSWPLPGGDAGSAWVLSRETLDALLLTRAGEAGAVVLQPRAVRGVLYARDGVSVVLADGTAIPADVAVHADGRGRFDAPDGRGRVRLTPMRRGVTALKCRMRPPADGVRGIRMRSAEGAYIGMVEVEGGLATIALVARRGLIARHRGDADGLLRALWPAYDPARRVSPWAFCGVGGGGCIRSGHDRSFRIGNAAAAVEPVGGEGIGVALWAGRALAGRLAPTNLGDDRSIEALRRANRRFRRDYRVELRLRRPTCRLAAWVLERPALVRRLWPALAWRAGRAAMLKPWFALTGKPVWSARRGADSTA